MSFLVEDYMLNLELEFVATGSFSLELEGEASPQADESYCFGAKKFIPDLAIEVVITSGGSNKLKRYQALGVQEVWFWKDGIISVHQLTSKGYVNADGSRFVKGINLDLMARCASIESRPEAVREFRQGL